MTGLDACDGPFWVDSALPSSVASRSFPSVADVQPGHHSGGFWL